MTTVTNGKATELITFTRGSLATVTDSDGKIKWAPHNLLLASEQFDASAWTKGTVTVTANNAVAPNGTTTADKCTASGADSFVSQTVATTVGIPYVFSIWLRSDAATSISLSADANLQACSVTTEWQLFTLSFSGASGVSDMDVRIGGYSTFSTGEIVYAWGASLTRADLGGMQANASAYPMYNPTTPKNLLGYSEDFSNAAWNKFSVTVTANATVSPNGTTTADLVADNGAVFQTGIVMQVATNYTFKVWAKGVVGGETFRFSYKDTTEVSPTQTVTTEWQLFEWTGQTAFGTDTRALRDIVGDIYFWGAQLSDSASLDAYSPNFGAAPSAAAYHGPRLDFDGSSQAARGLLVEEQRTNLLLRSAEFDNASWSKASATVSANTVTSPDGTAVADTITAAAATAAHYISQSVTWTAVVHTVSVYVKQGTQQFVQITTWDGTTARYANFDIQNGTAGSTSNASSSITAVGNGWYRVSLTTSTAQAAASGNVTVAFANSSSASANTSYATAGTETYYLFGAQVEAGSFATSYIPTAASTVTRNADVASVGVSQFPYSATEGTWVANFQTLYSGVAPSTAFFLSLDGTSSKRMLYIASGTDTAASTDGATIITATGDVTGASAKAASAYDASGRYVVSNGGTVASGTIAAGYATGTIISISLSSNAVNGHIRQITYIPRRLTNAELQSRTA